MLIVDANVLLYAVNDQTREYEAARSWLKEALRGGEAVGFTWPVVLAFLRVGTHPAIFDRPLSTEQAGSLVKAWLGARPAVLVEPSPRHLSLLLGLLDAHGSGGDLVNDAHLAAAALDHRATVVSFDRDFARFEGVSWSRPE